jgi:16S rRNA (guanine(966)-N(2))-methyltransferase RsmD
MRIVAGKLKGQRFAEKNNFTSLRPTTEKVRQAIFNILTPEINTILATKPNIKVLDLACGSGAFSFETISRFPSFATLVDYNAEHLQFTQESANSLEICDRCSFLRLDLYNIPLNNDYFDIIFLDPPYSANYWQIISDIAKKNWLQKNSLFVVEFTTQNDNFLTYDLLKIIKNPKLLKSYYQDIEEKINKKFIDLLHSLDLIYKKIEIFSIKSYGDTGVLVIKLQ